MTSKNKDLYAINSMELNMYPVNAYILVDEASKECVLIDPACYGERDQKRLKMFIEEQGLKPSHLLCTHLHADHSMGNAFVNREYGLPLQASAEDAYWIELGEKRMRANGITPLEKGIGIGKALKEGDVINFGESKLKVIAVPGHSPGGLAFYWEAKQAVFVGDSLFQLSIGRTDLPGGDAKQLLANIKKKLFTLPDETIVYPGHGEPSMISYEKKNNPFF